MFELALRDDTPKLREQFDTQGSVSIENFLVEGGADKLSEFLARSDDWIEVFQGTDKVFEMPAAAYAALDAGQLDMLDKLVGDAARKGFQYRYRTIRVPDAADARRAIDTPLNQFAEFMNSERVMQALRDLTGLEPVNFADAQGTAYAGGHFLNAHDDGVEGKNRLAAFVFSLTRDWKADWGGLLLFREGAEVRGFVPAFNSLRIFKVPRDHLVSYVPPWVSASRYSVTGWLRAVDDPQTGS